VSDRRFGRASWLGFRVLDLKKNVCLARNDHDLCRAGLAERAEAAYFKKKGLPLYKERIL